MNIIKLARAKQKIDDLRQKRHEEVRKLVHKCTEDKCKNSPNMSEISGNTK